jgi:hypothetical protein
VPTIQLALRGLGKHLLWRDQRVRQLDLSWGEYVRIGGLRCIAACDAGSMRADTFFLRVGDHTRGGARET